MTMKNLLAILIALLLAPPVTSAAQGYRYDVNRDGEINIADVNSIISVILDDACDAAADVNGDGEMNIGDINALIDNIFGCENYPEFLEFYIGGVSFRMLKVDGGTFAMGSNNGESNEAPVHEVTLSSYYIGETEVTQALWTAAGAVNRSYFQVNDRLPVENATWEECQEFIDRLNVLTGYHFSLPTEAQWEFAARGGNESKGYLYAGSDDIGAVAWYSGNSNVGDTRTHVVASLQPNELGLYDMSGNVTEWCQDWYGRYSGAAQVDPTGPTEEESYRERGVQRGGSWVDVATKCRVTARNAYDNSQALNRHGMRLALKYPAPVALGVSNGNVETFEGEVTTVLITNGKGSYYATSADEQVATASVHGGSVAITAVGVGTTTITIYDDETLLQAQVLVRVGKNCFVNGVTFKMMHVEGGTFLMGNTPDQYGIPDSYLAPVHEVTLSSYCIGQTEVTQELWTAVMGSNPSDMQYINPKGPVEQVSWDACQEFIAKLNVMTGLNFRLPTEAEWEFAARGGNLSMHYCYSGSLYLEEVGWYHSNAGNMGPQRVAFFRPNELGLYDMSGNVSELCQDWFDIYDTEPQIDPTGPATGTKRVVRGGSYADVSRDCRCASRDYHCYPYDGGNLLGLRLVMSSK